MLGCKGKGFFEKFYFRWNRLCSTKFLNFVVRACFGDDVLPPTTSEHGCHVIRSELPPTSSTRVFYTNHSAPFLTPKLKISLRSLVLLA